jgi:23S rRNA (uracil1939-C5)-methyltransferase
MSACPHFPVCPGCPFASVPYPEQLRRKQAAIEAAFAAEPALASVAIEPISGSPRSQGYRNQAKLVFRARRRGRERPEIVLGVYRPGTHSVVPAERCPVHAPRLQPLLADLRAQVEALEIPVFDERTREGALRYALARVSTFGRVVHLTLVSATPRPPHLDRLIAHLRKRHPDLAAAFLCVNPTPGNALLSPDVRRLFGPPVLAERYGDVILESRPEAFFQANTPVAAQLYATAVRWLGPTPGDIAADLYCGAGAIALHLAGRVAQVLGIESTSAAVEAARANAARLGAMNVRFRAGDAAQLEEIVRAESLAPPSLVVVNPPRRGLAAEARAAIARMAPRRIAYVSCDPGTLARDLGRLADEGYETRRARAFDMLPQTPHVEALALAVRVTSETRDLPSSGDSR